MDNCSGYGVVPRISAPELYPVSIGGAIVRQSSGDEYLMNSVLFLNAGIGVSAIQTSTARKVLPSAVEIAWFSFTEKNAFYAECRLNEKYIARLMNDGYRLVNGSKGYYSYFDIALFPGGRIAFYLSGDERMRLVEMYNAKDADLPVSVFAQDSGFEDYEEFAEAFIRGDECNDSNNDDNDDGGDNDECAVDSYDGGSHFDFKDDTKAAWVENLIENGVDYPLIELYFKRYMYGVAIEFKMYEDSPSAGGLDEMVLSAELSNGEFSKYKGNVIPYDNYGLIRSLSFEYELADRSVLCDIYFDIKELATAFSLADDSSQGQIQSHGNSNGNSHNNTLHLSFDSVNWAVTAQLANENGCCNIERLRYRVAEYKDGRTVLKGGNC